MPSDARLRVVRWGDREIRYRVRFADRRRLSITVHPDLGIEVVAPTGQELEAVEERVHARRGWIARQLRELERLQPLPADRRWVEGESVWYLGRQYRLRISVGEPAVWRAGGRLHVRLPSRRASVEAAVRVWYQERAGAVLRERVERVRAEVPRLAGLTPKVRVQWMRTRWGSCSPAGTVTLNVELVKAPVSCIDYVVTHELCHMLELRHSRRFLRLLDLTMPDWRERRERLARVGASM